MYAVRYSDDKNDHSPSRANTASSFSILPIAAGNIWNELSRIIDDIGREMA